MTDLNVNIDSPGMDPKDYVTYNEFVEWYGEDLAKRVFNHYKKPKSSINQNYLAFKQFKYRR